MTFKDFLNELKAAKSNYNYEEVTENNSNYITFKLEDDLYAVDVKHVEEVIEMKKTIDTKENKKYIKGLIPYKKTLINVIDLRLRLDMKEKKYDNNTTIVITNLKDSFVGLIVDDVIEITSIPHKNISYNHDRGVYLSCSDGFVKGTGRTDGENKKLLDLDKIIYCDRYNILGHIVTQ